MKRLTLIALLFASFAPASAVIQTQAETTIPTWGSPQTRAYVPAAAATAAKKYPMYPERRYDDTYHRGTRYYYDDYDNDYYYPYYGYGYGYPYYNRGVGFSIGSPYYDGYWGGYGPGFGISFGF